MGADTVTYGNPQPGQVTGNQGLILDRQNNNFYSFGQSLKAKLHRALKVGLTLQTALTAITTAQNLLSQALNAGELSVVGRRLYVRGSLIYSTTSTNVATITIAVTLGGVTIATITTAATNTAASTNLPIEFEFWLTVTTAGASGKLIGTGRLDANIGTAAAGAITTYLATTTAASAAIDLTASQTLAVTIAASAAVPSAQLLDAAVEMVA